MDKKELKRTARSTDWTNDPKVKEHFPEIAKALAEDRRESVRRMKELGLPMAGHIIMGLEDFIANPEEYFSKIPEGKYYISINPLDPKFEGLKRCGESDLTREEVMKYIKTNIPPEKRCLFEIKLEEYANKFGGTIVIGGKNEIWIEFKKGRQQEIGSGTARVEYIAQRDRHTGVMRYSFEDEDLRKAIFQTLEAIPHKGKGRDKEYTSGYFEFALFERDGQLKPVFFDYKPQQEFQPDWEKQGDSHVTRKE